MLIKSIPSLEHPPRTRDYAWGVVYWLKSHFFPGIYLDWRLPDIEKNSSSVCDNDPLFYTPEELSQLKKSFILALKPYPSSSDFKSGGLDTLYLYSGRVGTLETLSFDQSTGTLPRLEQVKRLCAFLKLPTTSPAYQDFERNCLNFSKICKKWEDYRSMIRSLAFNNTYSTVFLITTFSTFYALNILFTWITAYSASAVIGLLLILESVIAYWRMEELWDEEQGVIPLINHSTCCLKHTLTTFTPEKIQEHPLRHEVGTQTEPLIEKKI